MYQFFETIKIVNGSILHLDYHQARMITTLEQNFSKHTIPELTCIISIPADFQNGLVKCRIEYNSHDFTVTYEKYTPRQINSLKLIKDDFIIYSYKYSDRSHLMKLLDNRGSCDDILIAKTNLITDTSFSNIIFFDGSEWHTPSSPLLKGTARARLLEKRRIYEREITINDLHRYSHFKLINSMLDDDFGDKKPVSAIV